MADRQYIFSLDATAMDPGEDRAPRALLGARGARLAELAAARLPMTTGFVISAEVCAYLARHERRWPPRFADELRERLRALTGPDGARFGFPAHPLLIAVQAESPDGPALPAIWNLGLNDRALQGFAQAHGERAAWDAYRRLLRRYGVVVAGCADGDFERVRRRLLDKYRARAERDLDAACLQELCDQYKRVFFEQAGRAFPQDPSEQLRSTLLAAYARWQATAEERRPAGGRGAPPFGIAVTVRAMAYGHLDGDSAVGSALSRDPATGENRPVGVYLTGAQEDDLELSGVEPMPLDAMANESSSALRRAHAELLGALRTLERRWRYPCEVRFVVERGRLLLTDAAPTRGTGRAAVRWAVEMAGEGGIPPLMSRSEALATLGPEDIENFMAGVATPESARRLSLLAAFQEGVRAARRHPDYGLFHILCKWTDMAERLRIIAETDHVAGVRLARRLNADGILFHAPPLEGDPHQRVARQRRLAEVCRTAARGLPVVIAIASLPTAVTAGVGWLVVGGRNGAAEGAQGAPASAPSGRVLATPREALLADQAAEKAGLLLLDVTRLTCACWGEAWNADEPKRPLALDVEGVGQLLETAVRRARAVRHDVAIWVRGLSPGDVAGLRFCARIGVQGVTTAAESAPVMRIAAAQAVPTR